MLRILMDPSHPLAYGMRAQHRGQPHRTFKLLFNGLYLPGLQEASLS